METGLRLMATQTCHRPRAALQAGFGRSLARLCDPECNFHTTFAQSQHGWDRMKFVCLFLVGVVVAQTLRRVSQVRWLVVLLVLSGFTAALYTGWQYTYGVGVRLVQFSQSSKLAQDGLRPNDLVVSFDGHKVHSPDQLVQVLQQTTAQRVTVEYVPGLALRSSTMAVAPQDFVQAGLGTPAMTLARGKPHRAQGTLGHYVIFAEMLTQIGCMAWALLLSSGRRRPGWLLVSGVFLCRHRGCFADHRNPGCGRRTADRLRRFRVVSHQAQNPSRGDRIVNRIAGGFATVDNSTPAVSMCWGTTTRGPTPAY